MVVCTSSSLVGYTQTLFWPTTWIPWFLRLNAMEVDWYSSMEDVIPDVGEGTAARLTTPIAPLIATTVPNVRGCASSPRSS